MFDYRSRWSSSDRGYPAARLKSQVVACSIVCETVAVHVQRSKRRESRLV